MEKAGDDRSHVAVQLSEQARVCSDMGSPLYGHLLAHAAENCRDGGPVWSVLRHHVLPGRGDAVALRFMAAMHRLVLTGKAPELAAHYPSVGGGPAFADPPGIQIWNAFLATVEDHEAALVDLVALPCQTNEVGRCAALAWGFLALAATTKRPLRCLEVGASAGLNLRWDRYRYGGAGTRWGPAHSPVDLSELWTDPPAALPDVSVVERRGCDVAPIDPISAEGQLALSASVWADMRQRFARLEGAIEVSRHVPATVDQQGLDSWVAEQLADSRLGVTTVVYHSVVAEYVPTTVWRRFRDALDAAGERASEEAPLAWLRLEPISAVRRHGLALTRWPGGRGRVLATSKSHGQDVKALEAAADQRAAIALVEETRRIRS